MFRKAVLVCGMIAVLAGVQSTAQTSLSSQGTIGPAGSFSGSASFGMPPPFAMPVVTGAPYSAEEVSENLKILTDGTRITQKNPGRKVWRDFDGRTRTERPMMFGPAANQASVPLIVEITDPVAGYKYTLDTQNKVAHRQTLPPQGTRPGAMRGAAGAGSAAGVTYAPMPAQIVPFPSGGGGGGRTGEMSAALPPPSAVGMTVGGGAVAPPNAQMRPRFANETLGKQTIEGVFAEGTRNTITYPVGMMGNDREFSVVTETWMSPDLKTMILSKTNDPRNGENTFRLQDLSRTPPDAMLFTVPPGYTVVDEAGAFTINYKMP